MSGKRKTLSSYPESSMEPREVPHVATGFVLNICQKGCCLPSNIGKMQQIVWASPALSEHLQPKASLLSHKPPSVVAMAAVGSSADITLCFTSSGSMLKDGGSRAGPCTTSTTASTPSLHHAVGLRGQTAELASSPCHQGLGDIPQAQLAWPCRQTMAQSKHKAELLGQSTPGPREWPSWDGKGRDGHHPQAAEGS